MKIDPPANALTGLGTTKVTSERTTVSVTNADGTVTSVDLGDDDSGLSTSPLSSEMRALQAALASSGSADIDLAKVAAIKQAIAEGRLSINTEQIAAGLIQTARDLLSSQSDS